MKLSELLKNIFIKNFPSFKNLESLKDVEIRGIQFDSRKIEKGDLFVATRGTVVDGHDFIAAAIEKGASVVICEKIPEKFSILNSQFSIIQVENSLETLGLLAASFYGNPSEKLTLVGITGTNGKTTTATLLYDVFRKLGYKVGLLSTVINYIDNRAVEATHTTPDPLELNALLAEMVAAGCEYAFMEVSSHAIEQRRIAGLRFAGGIFTNLTQDHLDYHGTMAEYLKAKKRFFDNLPADAFALTNLDDKNGLVMLQNTQAAKHTYSQRTVADFKTKILEEDLNGMLLNMNGQEVFVQFVGKFNASNLTAVFGAAVLLSEQRTKSKEQRQDGNDNSQFSILNSQLLTVISTLRPVSGRFETIYAPAGYVAVVDYAHTPDALSNVISTVNEILASKDGRLITVVGCGGNRDKTKRPLMAQEAVRGSWKAILTSDNPRNENPTDILNDMLAGLNPLEQQQTLVIEDRRQAIRTACTLAQKDDIVLIAGKGHEDYQIINGVKHHFDDREEVRKVIF